MMRRLLCAVLAMVLVVCLLPLNVIQVSAASSMKASEEIIRYLKTMEGFTAIPRWDYVQWTVGYGNRCPDEDLERYKAEGIPIEEADALFLEQLAYFEDQVNAFIDRNNLTYTQNQFDAILSITYNCGAAWLTGNSDLKLAVTNGTTGNKLIGIMSQWCTAGGEYLPGLMRRRLTEADMYLNGRYNTQTSDNYCYVFYDANKGTASGVAQGYDCNLYAIPMVTATREGYTFLGWYTEPTGGVEVTYLDENMHLDTLYAHWELGDGEYTGNTTEVPDGLMLTVTGDVLYVRSGPGTSYSVVGSVCYGDIVVVTQIAYASNGRPWGKIEDGWISLAYTNYSDVVEDDDSSEEDSDPIASLELPISATIIGSGTVNLYNGPDTGYPKVGTLTEGDQVQIVETYLMFTKWWARLESGGWVCMDQHILLHDDLKLAHNPTVTVTNSYVNVRSGPGTSYSWSGSLSKGEQVKIFAVDTVDGALWGRFSDGWISLQYTDFDSGKLAFYRNHVYGDWETAELSTCITHGYRQRECLYCDHVETEELPLSDHVMEQWYIAQESTCVTLGQERRECAQCDYYETRDLALSDHHMGQWYETVAPTLTECGEERRDCEHCDYFETRETEPAEHIFGEWYVVREATCTTEGEMRRDCIDCDYYETKTIAVVAHSYGQWYVVTEATCTEEGQQRRDCDCGLFETAVIEKVDHSYGEWYTVTEATLTENGEDRRDCQYCEHYQTRVTEFDGEVITRVYATIICGVLNVRSGAGTGYSLVGSVQYGTVHEVFEQVTVSGRVWGRIELGWICLTGNATLEEVVEIVEHTHSFGDWYTVTEATCTEAGLRRHDCACGHYETEAVAATGHRYGAWYTVTEATCTEAGLRRHDCACGHYETEAVAATGHSYGDWYTVTEATASQNGLERRDCACGHYETRETAYEGTTVTKIYATITVSSLNVRSGPGTGYSWVGAVAYGTVHEVLEQTTVGSKVWGRIEKGWICLTGYTTLEEVTEAEEHSHSFGAWYTVTEATCTANGEKRRDCSCGEYETEVIAATGHSYGEWYTVTEATATQNGLERRDCACGHYETRETAYEGTTVTKIYATITVASLNVRSGAGTGYSWVACVTQGERYEVYEQTTVGSKVWGRIEKGWICLTGYTTLEEVTETEGADSTAVVMTVRAVALNVRSGAGTGYGIVTSLSYGTEVTVLETKTVGNTTWARIEQGWVSMTYLK